MRKRVTAVALAGAVALGGVAVVAIPALADTSTPSPSAAPGTPGADRGESRIKELLKGLVGDKTLTQDQADKVAKTLAEADGGRGWGGGPGFGGFGGFGGGPGMAGTEGPEALDAAAKALGMSTDDVRSALRDGSTLADLAKKQGKDEAAVVTAIVDAIKARVAQAVKDGKLTQDQADKITESLQDRVKSGVENGRRMGGRGHGPDGMNRGPGAGRGGAEEPTPGPSASPGATGQTSSFVA